MKSLILSLIFYFISATAFAQTNIPASLNYSSNIVSFSIIGAMVFLLGFISYKSKYLKNYLKNRQQKKAALELFQINLGSALNNPKINIDDEWIEKNHQPLKDLNISQRIIDQIQEFMALKHLKSFLKERMEDRMLTNEEYFEILNEYKRVDVEYSYEDRLTFKRYNDYYKILSGKIPTIEPLIILQKNEVCYYFQDNASWNEFRKITQRVNYSGLTYRLKISKGLTYRIGSITSKRVLNDELTLIDKGSIHITDKRIIFSGNLGNKIINMQDVLGVDEYQDGVMIQKSQGKSPFISFNDPHMVNIVVSKLAVN